MICKGLISLLHIRCRLENRSLILVVDDQHLGQIALASLLEPEGYRLAFASSGPEALTQMRLLAPDLVLLDVMMPEMDGFEVCRRIRADPGLALIPVVMVTALDDQASLLQGLEAGADDFVSKPFSRVELRARVRAITRLNRFRTLLDEQRRVASARAQLLWAIERSADGYLLLDANERPQDGNARGWHYLDLSGPPAQLSTESFLTLAAGHHRLEPAEAWATWPEPTALTRYLVRTEGTDTLWLQVETLDLPPDGPARRLIHLHDVTGQIVAQRNIWAFNSFVSHKLRTPLTSLLGGMGILKRQASSLPDDLSMLVDTALGGAQRLKTIVDAIFRYLAAPDIHPPNEGTPLADLPALVAQLGTDLGLAELYIAADLDPDAGHLAIGAQTIELLIAELLENARKFHPLQRPAVAVSIRRRVDRVAITVADNGLHLTQSQLRLIWEPYQQIDHDFTGQVAGVGLGLATVAQICWAAGGSCRVSNRTDGPGLSVELELPAVWQPALTPTA